VNSELAMSDERKALQAAEKLRTILGEPGAVATVMAQPRGESHAIVVFCNDEALGRVGGKAPKAIMGFPVEVKARPQKGSTPGMRMNRHHGRTVLRDK
jgi:hypothetical protein